MRPALAIWARSMSDSPGSNALSGAPSRMTVAEWFGAALLLATQLPAAGRSLAFAKTGFSQETGLQGAANILATGAIVSILLVLGIGGLSRGGRCLAALLAAYAVDVCVASLCHHDPFTVSACAGLSVAILAGLASGALMSPRRWVLTVVVIGAGQTAFGLVGLLNGWQSFHSGSLPRMTAGYVSPVGLWIIDLLALACCVPLWLGCRDGRSRALLGAIGVLLLVGVLLTWYRLSFLSVGAVVLFAGASHGQIRRFLVPTIVLCACFVVSTRTMRYEGALSQASSARSTEGRWALAAQGMQAFRKSPLFGYGPAQTKLRAPASRADQDTRIYTDPKNLALHVLCERGVIGLAWLVGVITLSWRAANALPLAHRVALQGILVAFLTIGLTETPLASAENGFGLTLFAGVVGLCIRAGEVRGNPNGPQDKP